MRSRWNLPIFACYAALAVLVFGYLASQVGGSLLPFGKYKVTAAFSTASDLVPGDDVDVSGFQVGRVASVRPHGQGADVVLSLSSRYAPLYRDSRAVIRQKNLLGERYVELDRGTPASGSIPDGGVIPRQHTLTPVEVDQVLNALNPTIRDRLDITLNSLGQATAGRGGDMNLSAGDLKTLAVELELIAHTLSASSVDLGSLVSSLDKVIGTLAAYHAQVRTDITQFDQLMSTIAGRESALQGTLINDNKVMAILDQALSGSTAAQLQQALAQGPAALDNGNHYFDNAKITFTDTLPRTADINNLFFEMASAFSGDGHGHYAWRVYCTGIPACLSPAVGAEGQSTKPGGH
ncbi:MAG: MlaD family protein [Candidatus Dormibacteraceae bacterium]